MASKSNKIGNPSKDNHFKGRTVQKFFDEVIYEAKCLRT